MEQKQAQILRVAFLVGAITDALALVPMLSPAMAEMLWGIEDVRWPYRFAMGYGASLMAAWTMLLIWAYERPLERSFVAALTVLVIWGLVVTEIAAVWGGYISIAQMVPTWFLQTGLLALFAGGYHYPWLHRYLPAA
jgi:hypothetical protein